VADVVGLPEGGDFGEQGVFEGFELGGREWNAVEFFEEVGDAAALEHDAAAGDLGGMCGEDGSDADVCEQAERGGAVYAGGAEAAEGAAERAALWGRVGVEERGAAAALAVVGFGEVD